MRNHARHSLAPSDIGFETDLTLQTKKEELLLAAFV